jgi:hypothetical protein
MAVQPVLVSPVLFLCATSSIPAWSTRPTPNRVYDEIDELSGTFTAAVDPENGPRVVRRDEQKML